MASPNFSGQQSQFSDHGLSWERIQTIHEDLLFYYSMAVNISVDGSQWLKLLSNTSIPNAFETFSLQNISVACSAWNSKGRHSFDPPVARLRVFLLDRVREGGSLQRPSNWVFFLGRNLIILNRNVVELWFKKNIK